MRGKREGRGTVEFTNGAVYEGRFRDDRMEGQGTFKLAKNVIIPKLAREEEEGGSGGEKDEDAKSETADGGEAGGDEKKKRLDDPAPVPERHWPHSPEGGVHSNWVVIFLKLGCEEARRCVNSFSFDDANDLLMS